MELPASEYWTAFNSVEMHGSQVPAWAYPRAFWVYPNSIYINKDAFFIDATDKSLTLAHEMGHSAGASHTLVGVMSPIGLVRYFTASYEGAILLAIMIAVVAVMYWYYWRTTK